MLLATEGKTYALMVEEEVVQFEKMLFKVFDNGKGSQVITIVRCRKKKFLTVIRTFRKVQADIEVILGL